MERKSFTISVTILGFLALVGNCSYGAPDDVGVYDNGGNPQPNGGGPQIDYNNGTGSLALQMLEGSTNTPAAKGRLLEMRFVPPLFTTPTPTPTPYLPPYASIKAIDRSVIDSPLYDLSVVGKKLQFSTGSTLYGATQGAKEAMRINEDGTVIVNPLAKDMPMDGNNKSIGGVASSFHVNGNVSIAGNVAVSGTVQGVDLVALEKKVCELEKALAEARGQLYKAEYFGEAKRPGRRAERRSPGAQGLTHI